MARRGWIWEVKNETRMAAIPQHRLITLLPGEK